LMGRKNKTTIRNSALICNKMLITKNLSFVLILWISLISIQCSPPGKDQHSYSVRRLENPPEINAEYGKEIWKNTNLITLDNYMGDRPVHFPVTEVKLRYDQDNIYVIFSVMDRYIRAVAKMTHGKVWEDSCVEFFFSPGPDVERGYFNIETNCKGVFLFAYHQGNGKSGFVSEDDCKRIKISHSLTRDVEEEYAEPENWIVEYSIPVSVLSNYLQVDDPGPGVSWRANFYKCADKTSHPHWLTWAPVDYPKPKFHLPEFFGRLEFE
jgi:hypothetical protein